MNATTRSGRTRRSIVLEFIVLGALAALYLRTFYPGFLTPDPLYKLMQIRGVVPVNNWHPPAITALWHVLDWLVGAPGGLWLVQTALLFHSVVLVACTLSERWYLRVGVEAVLLLFPPLFANFGLLWKDNWFIVFLLYGFACGLQFEQQGRTRDFVGALLACLLTMLARFNGFTSALPLLIWVLYVRSSQRGRAGFTARKVLGATAGAVGVMVLSVVIGAVLERTYVRQHFASWQIIPLYDITGVSVNSGQLYLPAYIERGEGPTPAPTLAQLREIYMSHSSDTLVWGSNDKYRFPVPNQMLDIQQTSEQRKDILSAWVRAVTSEPSAYLQHRWSLYRHHLGLAEAWVCAPFHTDVFPNVFGWTFPPRPFTEAVVRILNQIRDSWVFRGWVYALALGLLTMRVWRQRLMAAWALWGSAVLTLVSNGFLLGACDFRYLLWPVVATPVLLFLVLLSLRVRRPAGVPLA
jgi:hypothetical protein